MNHGNQHVSERARLLKLLRVARFDLQRARFARTRCNAHEAPFFLAQARQALDLFRYAYNLVPASSRRRWKCGR